jgi:hypothetical protein
VRPQCDMMMAGRSIAGTQQGPSSWKTPCSQDRAPLSHGLDNIQLHDCRTCRTLAGRGACTEMAGVCRPLLPQLPRAPAHHDVVPSTVAVPVRVMRTDPVVHLYEPGARCERPSKESGNQRVRL